LSSGLLVLAAVYSMSVARADPPLPVPAPPAPVAPAPTSPAPTSSGPTSPAPTSTLDAVVVTTNKLDVETLIDRKVYSVQTDVQSTFGSLGDVLGAIPSVDVDGDGIVSLRGDTNVLILIDGRTSPQFSGPSAGDNLQSIPARDIERIEVMTNPPAEYKADGVAGVINIIMRKKRPQGASGTLQGSLGSGGRSVAGLNASARSGPMTASLTASYRHDIRHRLTDSDLVAPDTAGGPLVSNHSSIDEIVRRNVPTLAASAQYALDDQQTLSLDLTRSGRAGLRTYTELDGTSLPSGVVSGSSERLSAGHDREIDGDERLGFEQKLGRSGELLNVSLHHASSHVHEHYDYANLSFVPPAATFDDNLGFFENNDTSEFNADYTRPVSKSATLKLGYSYERDDYGYGAAGNNVDLATGGEVPDPNLTDDFDVRQQINSAYLSYQSGAGAWSWLGGLRAELASTGTRQLTYGLSTDERYLRLYPSLHVDRSLTEVSTLSFAASRRVTRPDPDNLNPYVDHEYAPNLVSGNPDLRPQFSQSYEVAYGVDRQGLTYSTTGYYRRNTDAVTTITEPLAGGLTLTTKTNLPRSGSAGLELGANGHFVPKLGYNISSNFFYSQIDATALGAGGLRSTTGINAKIKLDFRPTPKDALQLTATRTDKRLTPQGYVEAIDIVNLGYRRQLPRALTGVITVSNVFNGQRFQRVAMTPTFTQDYSRFVYGRIVYIGFVYSFGSVPKEKPQGFEYDQ
jgi:outer membrane receptor protein involved in Fe transport